MWDRHGGIGDEEKMWIVNEEIEKEEEEDARKSQHHQREGNARKKLNCCCVLDWTMKKDARMRRNLWKIVVTNMGGMDIINK